MTTFAFSSDRPLRVLLSVQNTELKSHISELLARAYYNIHGTAITTADSHWVDAMTASALHICMDSRLQQQSNRDLLHLFEDIIRVSEEHLKESRRHASMATNAFYLRETVLDNASFAESMAQAAQSTIVTLDKTHLSRLRNTPPSDA
jgi:hypothetical protein